MSLLMGFGVLGLCKVYIGFGLEGLFRVSAQGLGFRVYRA